VLRRPLQSERIERIDPRTGIRVVQITSYPTPSEHLGYDWPSITPDNERVIIACQRHAGREAPWDLFRCDTDGLNLCQLTERPPEAGRVSARLSLDGKIIYAAWGGEKVLRSLDVESGRCEDLFSFEPYCIEGGEVYPGVDIVGETGTLFLSMKTRGFAQTRLIRVDLSDGKAKEFGDDTMFYGYDFANDRLMLLTNIRKDGVVELPGGSRTMGNLRPGKQTIWSTDREGGDAKYVGTTHDYGHSTMLGRTGLIQGTGLPPERCIILQRPGGKLEKIVEGPYFWHSGGSFDGEWIVSDTNWPDVGLQLVHGPANSKNPKGSPHFRTLCRTGATSGGQQGGHAHPALSHDGRVAVFRSDRTDCSQVYLALITEEFRESVKAGVLDRPNDKWMRSVLTAQNAEGYG
jgi:hypothetical protein